MLKNRRSTTPTKDKSPSASGGAKKNSLNDSGGKRSSSFFNRGPSRSSLTSDRFNASATSEPPASQLMQPHWSENLAETVLVSDLCFEIEGGADVGQFPQVGRTNDYAEETLRTGDVLLEVQGQKVSGYTLADVTAWIKHCLKNRNPVVIKTATQGRKIVLARKFEF
jgi:hypothetical protein